MRIVSRAENAIGTRDRRRADRDRKACDRRRGELNLRDAADVGQHEVRSDVVIDVVVAQRGQTITFSRQEDVVVRRKVVARGACRTIRNGARAATEERGQLARVVERQAAGVNGRAGRGCVAIRVRRSELARQQGREVAERVGSAVRDRAPRRRARTTRKGGATDVARLSSGDIVDPLLRAVDEGVGIVAGAVRVIHDRARRPRVVVFGLEHAGAGEVGAVRRDVAAAIIEVAADQGVDVERFSLAAFGSRDGRADFRAFKVLLEDEVDDARNGVRAVHGRCAAGHDFDALKQAGRDGVDVDDARGGAARNTFAVDQDERTTRPKAAQVNRGEVFAAGVVRGNRVARDDLGQFVDQLFDRQRRRQFDVLRADRGHGADCGEVLTRNTRTRHNNDVTSFFRTRFRSRRSDGLLRICASDSS